MPAKTIGYRYNADGSRAGMTTPSGNFAYGYDALGRPTSLTNPQSQVTNWTYLDNDWLKSQTLSNGASTSFTRNAMGQTLGVTTRNGAGAILSQFGHESTGDLMLSYDGEGKLTKLRALLTNASNLSGTTLYGYNAKNELTSESSTRSGTYNNSFGYDATGNPTTWSINSQNTTRTFNVNNQETTGGTTNFNYDGEGNPTTYKGVGLSFNVHNNLTGFGAQLTAGYRSDGKRAWKQNASGARTYFLYDGDEIIAELNAAGTVTYTSTWGANGLVSRRDEAASVTRFYTWDNQGNVAQRLDASGSVIDSFSFTAFGQKTGSGGDPYTNYNGQWGYYNDYETGLILCTHRYYDPSNGRWLTRDPIGYDGGLNLYGYVTNNPVNGVDPSGLVVDTPSNALRQAMLTAATHPREALAMIAIVRQNGDVATRYLNVAVQRVNSLSAGIQRYSHLPNREAFSRYFERLAPSGENPKLIRDALEAFFRANIRMGKDAKGNPVATLTCKDSSQVIRSMPAELPWEALRAYQEVARRALNGQDVRVTPHTIAVQQAIIKLIQSVLHPW